MTAERIAVDPAQIIAEVVSLLRVRAAGKNLMLTNRYPTPVPRSIASDLVRLRQILMNLAGNAVNFTESGTVQIVALLAGTMRHLAFASRSWTPASASRPSKSADSSRRSAKQIRPLSAASAETVLACRSALASPLCLVEPSPQTARLAPAALSRLRCPSGMLPPMMRTHPVNRSRRSSPVIHAQVCSKTGPLHRPSDHCCRCEDCGYCLPKTARTIYG